MAKSGQRTHGIKRGERFAMIPEKVAHSEAFCSLTASAHRLLVLALTKYHGKNNGDIALTRSDLKSFGFNSQDTLTRSIKQLLDTGLLVLTRQGGIAGGGKRANLYAFGWLDIPENSKLDIVTPTSALDGWASFKIKHKHRPVGALRTDSCVVSEPIPADLTHLRTAPPVHLRTGPPDTFLRSSPEGHPPIAAKAGSGGLEAGGQ